MSEIGRANYGTGECPRCQKTIALKKDGTLRHHYEKQANRYADWTCEGAGEKPLPKPPTAFPGEPGSMWRDSDGDVWALCDDGRMRQTHSNTAPEDVERVYGPMTRIGGA
jgi:hypothetical protein